MAERTVTIALDAMGGDLGLDATLAGAARISREEDDIHVIAVGDVVRMHEMLSELRYNPARLSLVDAPGVVPMDAKPRHALDEMPDCSVAVAARLVRDGQADALVSAGHTGATVLTAARTFSVLSGIRRAALASVYPTEQQHGPKGDPFALMLDVGATLHATAEDLVGFAVMGAAYSSIISEIPSPRVALLSNGSEPNKGTPSIVEAHARLAGGPLHFIGNIEGLDIPRGTADVIICDGFLGNVVLKVLEGVGDVLHNLTTEASARRLQWRMGLAMLGGGLRQLQRMTDWKVYGGAPLLGFDRIVIKAHGRSESGAIRNAIKVGAKSVRGDLIGRIEEGVTSLQLESAISSDPPA